MHILPTLFTPTVYYIFVYFLNSTHNNIIVVNITVQQI